MKETTQTTGKSPTTTDVGRVSIQGLLIISAQLALLLLLFRQFQIESAAFLRLAMLAFLPC